MGDDAKAVVAEAEASDAGETFNFVIDPILDSIELFELTFPRPPQGTWRDRFDIRADVRFAHMELSFEDVDVRISTRGARLTTVCVGCSLLPHSLYGLHPLPSRSVISVQERHTQEVSASGAAQAQAKIGGLQMVDGSATLEAKASGETARRIERQASREEAVPRIVPRPHGAWDFNEPHLADGCLEGDYLTSRGQYLDRPSEDAADLPLATVEAFEASEEISVELTMEIQSRDLVFRRIARNRDAKKKRWYQREKVNAEVIARRLFELAHKHAPSDGPGRLRVKLGTATLRGRRRKKVET